MRIEDRFTDCRAHWGDVTVPFCCINKSDLTWQISNVGQIFLSMNAKMKEKSMRHSWWEVPSWWLYPSNWPHYRMHILSKSLKWVSSIKNWLSVNYESFMKWVGSCSITVENCCRCNIRLGYRSGIKRTDKDHLYLHFLFKCSTPVCCYPTTGPTNTTHSEAC